MRTLLRKLRYIAHYERLPLFRRGQDGAPAINTDYPLRRARGLYLALAAAVLIALGAFAASCGSVSIPLDALVQMVASKLGSGAPAGQWPTTWPTILFDIRLPRIVLAGLVGSALATSGATYQGLLRNPLADPYLVGISSGAALGATIAIVFGGGLNVLGQAIVPLFAFAGALLSTAAIYVLARAGGRATPMRLILAGVALGAFLSSITSFLMLKGDDAFSLHQVVAWTMGSFALANWQSVGILLPYLALGWVALFLHARPLNVLQLGDTQAQQLGVSVERVTATVIIAVSLVTAGAVAATGVIGFVGLVVPHMTRLIWGPDHRFLLPMSALVGAGFLIIADTIARTILAPSELPVGIITAFCGAPFFLYLLNQRKEQVM